MLQKDQKKSKINNCWDCALHKKGGVNAFGLCMWWDKPKEIPVEVVDKGCKFWKENSDEFHPLLKTVIEKFKGVLIE